MSLEKNLYSYATELRDIARGDVPADPEVLLRLADRIERDAKALDAQKEAKP